MPRAHNRIGTKALRLSTTPQVHEYLAQLVATGLYGKTEAEAAERLLTRALDEFLASKRVMLKQKSSARRR